MMAKATSTTWSGEWKGAAGYTGNGVVITATVVSHRPHSVLSSKDIQRYHAIVFDMESVHRRTFDKYGAEIEPKTETETVVIKGHLTMERQAATDPNAMKADELCAMFGDKTGNALPNGYNDPSIKLLHPTVPLRFEAWGDPNAIRNLDLKSGDKIRFKTETDSIFIKQIARNDGKLFTNYAGGAVINDVQKVREEKGGSSKPLKHEQKEGCDDSEWD